MNKIKIIFCLFLFILSTIYINNILNKINLFEFLISKEKTSLAISTTLNSRFNEGSKLNIENINKEEPKEKIKKNTPEIYLYNTHQTEEYKSSAYNITPTVVTVSEMLKEELSSQKIESIVETKAIKKGLNKKGYDYSYSYRISLEYLKEQKSKYPSLKYYFDIHRDSVKGNLSKVTINNKNYAKIMFLIGKNHKNYKENEKNIKIMESYLKENYKGILRETYYQPLYSYNQEYDENMFLIEVGGVDNTLEELYNTSVALSKAISFYVGGQNEK